jgi:hypothetical protein
MGGSLAYISLFWDRFFCQNAECCATYPLLTARTGIVVRILCMKTGLCGRALQMIDALRIGIRGCCGCSGLAADLGGSEWCVRIDLRYLHLHFGLCDCD